MKEQEVQRKMCAHAHKHTHMYVPATTGSSVGVLAGLVSLIAGTQHPQHE